MKSHFGSTSSLGIYMMSTHWTNILSGHKKDSSVFKVVCKCIEILMNISLDAENIFTELQAARIQCLDIANKCETGQLVARISVSVICDLRGQGWDFKVEDGQILGTIQPPSLTPSEEKARVRASLLIERDAQLLTPSVQKFIERMEHKRPGPSGLVSIFSLMRDGSELAEKLRKVQNTPEGAERNHALRNIIDPYIQVVNDEKCEHTHLELKEIWRYFRHTWVNSLKSVPGRNVWFLIRDRAAENHPIIGIAALGSSIVQMKQRDIWIGWDGSTFIESIRKNPDPKWLNWISNSLQKLLSEIYLQDLLDEDAISKTDLKSPSEEVINRLLEISREAREGHRLYPKTAEHKKNGIGPQDWEKKAQSLLFRSKRAGTLANLLQAKYRLLEAGFNVDDPQSLIRVLKSKAGRSAVTEILRRIKATHVGINMMDIMVCGAVPPYNPILGGKLVSLLMMSSEVVEVYHKKYENASSIIASSMAGQSVVRNPQLVLLGTTSLYGVGSSQYNRLNLPAEAVGGTQGKSIRYFNLGHTEGWGSYQFSEETLEEIEIYLAQNGDARRVNSIFGEGVNPRLRKIRDALDKVGFSSDILLKHGNKRVIYGVPLASNFRDVLLGLDDNADYILPQNNSKETTSRIVDFWIERWLSRRIQYEQVIEKVARNSLLYPIEHVARVQIPNIAGQLSLFHDL